MTIDDDDSRTFALGLSYYVFHFHSVIAQGLVVVVTYIFQLFVGFGITDLQIFCNTYRNTHWHSLHLNEA